MNKLLFIGQAPSRETDGQPPFVGRCGKFLAEDLLGMKQEDMLLQFEFVNVLERWPGKGLNGDLFPLAKAKVGARRLVEHMRNRTVVLLGHNVARAFGCEKFQYFRWYDVRHPDNNNVVIAKRCAIVPHPSGVNRLWNLKNNRLVARKFLMEAAAQNLPTTTPDNPTVPEIE